MGMRTYGCVGLCLLVLMMPGTFHAQFGLAQTSAAMFPPTSFPEAPSQRQAWAAATGPTTLPAPLVRAASELFELGLADPRSCEYRKISITIGELWGGDGGTIDVHGWLLPAPPDARGDAQRFAIAWNGLIYPVVAMGDKTDMKADALAFCEVDEEMRQEAAKERPVRPFYRFRYAVAEANSASEKQLFPIRACLLLRLGETALVARAWSDWTAGMDRKTNDDAVHLDDPYLMLAGDWLWSRFDRAVTAHMRGDDRLSLLDAQALLATQKQADDLAVKHGFKNENRGDATGTFFSFLEPTAKLAADAQRRLSDKPGERTVDAAAEKIPDQTKRIAALIANLDQVSARQWGQPGGVALGGDLRIRALIQEGDPAVEPLLVCLEKDDRLTRSVHFWRDFHRSRSLIGVHEAAYVALSGILDQSFFAPVSTGDDLSAREGDERRSLVKQIRDYWNQYKGSSKEERWFKVLANDNASPEQWIRSAASITQPCDEQVNPYSMFGGGGWVKVPSREPGKPIPMRGESLRKHLDPSVADLLAKRLEQLSHAAFIGKVPADEVEFTLPGENPQSAPLALGLKWRIQLPGRSVSGNRVTFTPLFIGGSMPVTLSIRNTLGTTQSCPIDWYHPDKHALREAVELHLEFNSNTDYMHPGKDKWEELPAHGLTTFFPGDAHVSLEPTEESQVATIELKDLFNLDKAGNYRVKLVITKPLGKPYESAPCQAQFNLTTSAPNTVPAQ